MSKIKLPKLDIDTILDTAQGWAEIAWEYRWYFLLAVLIFTGYIIIEGGKT